MSANNVCWSADYGRQRESQEHGGRQPFRRGQKTLDAARRRHELSQGSGNRSCRRRRNRQHPIYKGRFIMKKLTPRDVIGLADPATTVVLDGTLKTAQDRYDTQIQAALAEIRTILAGRSPRGLQGATAIAYVAAQRRFDTLVMEQKRFAKAELARRLDSRGDGNDLVGT